MRIQEELNQEEETADIYSSVNLVRRDSCFLPPLQEVERKPSNQAFGRRERERSPFQNFKAIAIHEIVYADTVCSEIGYSLHSSRTERVGENRNQRR